jgi:copper resistance protein C
MTSTSAPRGAFLRPALVAVLVGLLAFLGAGPAAAHDVLEGSDPADGSSVATAPSRITLTFDEAPTPNTATITVVGPDGTTHYESGAPTSDGAKISVGVAPLGAAGRYEIGYRVVSDDGHPVSGALSFTLTTPGPAAAAATTSSPGAPATTAPPVTPSNAAAASPAADEGGVPAWPFVVLAIVVVLGAVVLVLRRRA